MAETQSKPCAKCGSLFLKRSRDSAAQWEARSYCSILCSNSDPSIRSTPIEQRFWRYVEKTPGCWKWLGSSDSFGYGRISRGRGMSPEKAYRLSYMLHVGNIPVGMVVRHSCDNPNCVNPVHLQIGTQKLNAQDMAKRGRQNPRSKENLRRVKRAFSLDEFEEVKRLIDSGKTRQEVAKIFGVHQSTISYFLNGKRNFR